jgi:hypothetical protein
MHDWFLLAERLVSAYNAAPRVVNKTSSTIAPPAAWAGKGKASRKIVRKKYIFFFILFSLPIKVCLFFYRDETLLTYVYQVQASRRESFRKRTVTINQDKKVGRGLWKTWKSKSDQECIQLSL